LIEVDLASNLAGVEDRIQRACRRASRSREEVTLIAVTKNMAASLVEAAYNLGLRSFGENRVQEAEKKIKSLAGLCPAPTWHLIGHLQSNKVKTSLEIFNFIQSVDTPGLALKISRHASQKMPVLIEVNVAGEVTKSGFSPNEIRSEFRDLAALPGSEIRGLMTVAPAAADPEQVRPFFRALRILREELKLEHLSMGMTDDFEVAIEEGATMVRIGRAIFGERKI